MSNDHPSDSIVQQEAECIMFHAVQEWLNIDLQKNVKVRLTDAPYPFIEPDFYSKDESVIGEIFAHIGKPKRGQHNKIANDVLKMLLLEKMTGRQYRKIIVVCDAVEENHLKGKSALAESIRQFGIEVKKIDLDDAMRTQILTAQARQVMVNSGQLVE